MYQALYRKWRPQVFSDVYGQTHITAALKNEVKLNRLSHAYLFTGSRGTGKTTCAKILAKAVNCLNPENGDPCNKCEACEGINNGSILDVLEIDAASNNGVDNIRGLREEANFTPIFTKYRVYIIDEVHMLSMGAFNALLKTLEEPPAHVIFILATTEAHKLPSTIMSRCQRFNFRHIPSEDIAKRLDVVAKGENVNLDPEAAQLIARISDGALRDALSLLDQCVSADKNITSELVENVAGLTRKDYLFELSKAIRTQNAEAALIMLDELHNSSCDMRRLCSELLNHFRNYMLIKTLTNSKNLIICSSHEYENMVEETKHFTLETIIYVMDVLQDTLEKLGRGSNQRVDMEITLIKVASKSSEATLSAILSRISNLENALASGEMQISNKSNAESEDAPIEPIPLNKTPSVKASDNSNKGEASDRNRQKPPSAEPPDPESFPSKPSRPTEPPKADEPFIKWGETLEALRKIDIAVTSILNNSSAYIRGDFVLISSENPLVKEFISKKGYAASIKEAIRQTMGKEYKLGIYKSPLKRAQEPEPIDKFIAKARELGFNIDVKE